MADPSLFDVSVTFALVTGTAAGLLALLSWEIFRTSPYGRAVFTLTAVMVAFTLYHAALLVVGPDGLVAIRIVESAIFTGMAAFIGLMIWSQRRHQSGTVG